MAIGVLGSEVFYFSDEVIISRLIMRRNLVADRLNDNLISSTLFCKGCIMRIRNCSKDHLEESVAELAVVDLVADLQFQGIDKPIHKIREVVFEDFGA